MYLLFCVVNYKIHFADTLSQQRILVSLDDSRQYLSRSGNSENEEEEKLREDFIEYEHY